VDPRASLDDVQTKKFLTLPGLELRPLSRPARSQSLYRLRYHDSYCTRASEVILCIEHPAVSVQHPSLLLSFAVGISLKTRLEGQWSDVKPRIIILFRMWSTRHPSRHNLAALETSHTPQSKKNICNSKLRPANLLLMNRTDNSRFGLLLTFLTTPSKTRIV
jgi:hypothetical protein